MTKLTEDLALALALADAADAITMRSFQSTFTVRTKADRTPVTEVDEAVERAIRATLERERPDDGIVGEEFGARGTSPRRWIIDPIDATKNFIRGIPVFGTLIALDGQVGVVSAPALHRRWWAARGDGAFCNGAPIRVSAIDRIGEAQLSYDDLSGGDNLLALLHACGRTRAFGDFWSHMLVAEGAVDIAVEPQVAHWDMAAVQVIVEEAGGRFTSYAGEPRADAGSAVSTNGLLHEEVLRWLNR
ncbi:MAG: inositol monophosphatase family protein [Acidobacteriota bacterium]